MSEEKEQGEAVVKYSMSGGLVQLLHNLDLSIAATSYQSGRLYLLGRNPKGGLMVNEQFFEKAMGLAYHGGTLFMASLGHVHQMENILAPDEVMADQFTDAFVPRQSTMTGHLDAHDVGVLTGGELVFVNTRYNCLATPSQVHSFKMFWKPDFISELVEEDRCHLNGLAMREGKPAFVTAVSRSDTIDGWRDRRSDGGVIVDVETNKIVCSGLSMPHSPRVYADRLWVLNSGTGELGWVDFDEADLSKRFRPLCFCPGFVRGLDFRQNYAFVGLSRPRYERFEGLELDDRLQKADSEPWCGIQVIDLNTGRCVEWFRIDGEIGELYDVAVLPGIACARSFSFLTKEAMGVITIEQ